MEYAAEEVTSGHTEHASAEEHPDIPEEEEVAYADEGYTQQGDEHTAKEYLHATFCRRVPRCKQLTLRLLLIHA